MENTIVEPPNPLQIHKTNINKKNKRRDFYFNNENRK